MQNQNQEPKPKRNKILITGGLGFIFSHVTEYFVAKDWDVVVIDNQSEGSHPEIIDDSFTYYKMDVANAAVIATILQEQPDYVVHAAANSSVDDSIRKPYEVVSKNVMGTLNVFSACRQLENLKKLLYISTDEVYGECEYRKFEEDIIFPKNPYSASKAFGSILRYAFDNTYPELKDKTAETRFCNVFGPRQDERKILPAIKWATKHNRTITMHNDGKGYREYIYVKEIPPVIDLILEKGNRTYNVTNNDGFTVRDLIHRCNEITGHVTFVEASNRPGMDMVYQMDNQRIKSLGWQPQFNFESNLKEYLLDD